MNIGITGYGGNVGREMVKRGCTPLKCDVTNKSSIETAIGSVQPDLIVHLASKSNVDFCENALNSKVVSDVNLIGAYNVFDVAEQKGISVVTLSSDHIFNGHKGKYKEDEIMTVPVNHYGLTKLTMEAIAHQYDNVKIVRSSVLFSLERYLIQQYFEPLKNEQPIFVPTFLYRSFMYIPDFADSLLKYISMYDIMPKILNVAGGPKPICWYDFVKALAQVFKFDLRLINKKRHPDNNFEGAVRPHKAGLDITLAKRLGFSIPSYVDGLKRMRDDYLVSELGYE